MVVNETILSNQSLVYDVVTAFGKASIGEYVNQILFIIGGLGSATLLYFIIVIWLNYKQYKQHEEQLDIQRLQLVLLDEQYKMLKEIHKVYYPEHTQEQHGGTEQTRISQPLWRAIPNSMYDTTRSILHRIQRIHRTNGATQHTKILFRTPDRNISQSGVQQGKPVVPPAPAEYNYEAVNNDYPRPK